jgi:Polyketide cyclase / dehydrase and lipid transport
LNSVHRLESNYPVRSSISLALLLLASSAALAANPAEEPPPRGDIEVTVSLDLAEQSGAARATVRIRASREIVWSLITSCPETLKLVPGIEDCDVLATAPDGSWQKIRHVMNYSWYLPTLTYVIRATYDQPSKVSIERISGDLRTLTGSWELSTDGDYTIAHYTVELVPGFWVPHWIVRSALRRDLPKMLRALRTRAEALQSHKP